MNTEKEGISLCLIVKNEEERLGKCLESIQGLFDEIVVVDTGSSDKTKEVAIKWGAVVFDFKWIDDFSAARNYSIACASYSWIFWLDADETVSKENYRKLKLLLEEVKEKKVKRKAFLMRKFSNHPDTTYYFHDVVRLFPKHKNLKWVGRAHEQVQFKDNMLRYTFEKTPIVIHHGGYTVHQECIDKLKRNLKLLKMDQKDDKNNATTLFFLGRTYAGLGQPEKGSTLVKKAVQIIKKKAQETKSIPSSFLAYVYLTWIQIEEFMKHFKKALAICKEAVAFYPLDANLLFEKAMMHEKLGEKDEAEQDLLALLKEGTPFTLTDPLLDQCKVRYRLAEFYLKWGNKKASEKLLLESIKKHRLFTPASIALSNLWIKEGRLEEVKTLIDLVRNNLHNEELAQCIEKKLP